MAQTEAGTKEGESFLRDLQLFHETRGTPFKKFPVIGGKEVDLYLLYNLVTSQGGWIKVNSRNGWTELLEHLKVPKNCVNGDVALKQIYLRYLDRWEKVHFLGEEADRGSDEDEESRHKRWSARALHSVPLTYNHNQHNIAEANREYNHLSTDLYKASEYDKLALSLLSPLPNEQDFAINVCTLLSNESKHTLKLERHPRIVDYLLGHAGVFCHNSLRKLFVHYYREVRRHPITDFWDDVLDTDEFLDLTDENQFVGRNECTGPIDIPSSVEQEDDDANDPFRCRMKKSDYEMFAPLHAVGTQDYIGQRIMQITTILRNLSFIEENVTILVRNRTFLRYLLLCAGSRWGQLRNYGLDMLGNVSSDFPVKDLPTDRLAVVLLRIVVDGLKSEDRAYCISALEILNKLCQNETNEDALQRYLEPEVYKRVCMFLTIHDVMLLIYTLECLYSLSSLGEKACNHIVSNHGVVDTLVSLVTVEGKSYGPKACIGMKLVETVPGTIVVNSNVSQTPASASSSSQSTSTPAATSTTQSKITCTPVRAVQISPQRLLTISSSTVATSVTLTSTPIVTASSQSLTPQQLIQQQHAHQQTIHENEQFALAWLRATYEPCTNGKVEQQELYKHYINSCSKIGRRGVISPLHFPRCVRSVFGGTVGPNSAVKTSTGSNDAPQYYEGIKVRVQPLIINIQSITNPLPTTPLSSKGTIRRKITSIASSVSTTTTTTLTASNTVVGECNASINSNDSMNPSTSVIISPASPILKAQLSAPPKQRDTTAPTNCKGDVKSQAMAHPHLSQALLGTTNTTPGSSKDNQVGQSNTSLIKSLLATKVNDCMTTVSMRTATDCQNVAQVAARQQQQRMLAQQTNTSTPQEIKSTPTIIPLTKNETPKSKVNGVRQLFVENDVADPSVSSTTITTTTTPFVAGSKGKREPPQPPPPLAPLTNRTNRGSKIENEDSDSTGNNSLASSSGMGTIGIGGGVSSTEDGENSLTSFEGLLNGVPNIDNPLNEDSNSKDSTTKPHEIAKNKPLRLADLLEKKVEKGPPLILNGVLGKEFHKSIDLVENHIEKVLSQESNEQNDRRKAQKRPAVDDPNEGEAKKVALIGGVNGSVDSPAPESVTSSNGGDEGSGTVSTAAAKLFADIAADILEDEDEEQLMQEAQPQQQQQPQPTNPEPTPPLPQPVLVDGNQQVILTTQQRPIAQAGVIVSQQQMKTQTGQTVIVQNAGQQQRTTPVVLQSANTGQILLSQGQMQLVPNPAQPGQFMLQTSGTQGAYVVAQPQTAVVHGQPQTVLVAQTSQQQGGPKTIIILQQQPSSGANTATHHQKVVVTPQGQQVVVTQVPRPILHTSSVTNNIISTSSVIKTLAVGTSATTTVANFEKKIEETKPKIQRDLTTPFVCEWGDCNVDIKFKSANQVYLHACEAHCPKGSEESVCQWDRCDNMKRKRFSLMTHLTEKHCNLEAMKLSLTRRKQTAQGAKVEPAPTPTSTPHPGYAPDAALHAIKRHALEFVNPKELQQKSSPKQNTTSVSVPSPRPGPSTTEQDDNEGPVTKSIRLTASLILRNLVIYSGTCRRYLKPYEPHLANVALSNVESSRTIAQVLYDMNEGSNHR